ncbi:MAG: hypothetical protein AMXMBFR13_00780 [Phycisphaerae bacterium]
MDTQNSEPLENALKHLTWWTGPTPHLWRRALAAPGAQNRRPSTRLIRVFRSPWPWVGAPIAAAILLAVTLAARDNAALPSCDANLTRLGSAALQYAPSEWLPVRIGVGQAQELEGDGVTRYFDSGGNRPASSVITIVPPDGAPGQQSWNTHTSTPSSSDRHVIRKAAIDLAAEDVRGVYLKIQSLIPNQAAGEFVESSQIHDTTPQLTAYLTLRVANERLSAVMDALRGLGEVVREQTEASDVSAQVVDIEARLRNERRVEQELVELLDKRQDAPLEDVLKVSQSLSEVRERIEKLEGERQGIGRQVALATIVISIRAKDAPPQQQTGLASQLWSDMSDAWVGGLSFLIDTLAMLVRILIGGLIWWVLLGVGLWLLRHWVLRRTV